jgi:hypothetical protein
MKRMNGIECFKPLLLVPRKIFTIKKRYIQYAEQVAGRQFELRWHEVNSTEFQVISYRF